MGPEDISPSRSNVNIIELPVPSSLLKVIAQYGEPAQVILELLNRSFNQDIDLISGTYALSRATIRFWDRREKRVRITQNIDYDQGTVSYFVGKGVRYRTFDEIELIRPTPYKDTKRKTIYEWDYLLFRDEVYVVIHINGAYHVVNKETNQLLCFLKEVNGKADVIGSVYQDRLQRANKQ